MTDGTWSYTWEHGRELASMTSGTVTWTYTYNADGIRTTRTNGTKTYNYVYNSGSLSQMTVGNDTLYFSYDAEGIPMAVVYNGVYYYYVTSLQGDVVAIVDSAGHMVVAYSYDAWGNPIGSISGTMAATLGTLNPLRYRGYTYDQETNLYYLQSRYYNPETGRFINADGALYPYMLGYNMFAYCFNNPVNYLDKTGKAADSYAGWIGELVGEWLYELLTGRAHPNKRAREVETRMVKQQNDMVANIARKITEAYVQSYNLQQESQIFEAKMTLEGAIKVKKFLNEHEELSQGLSGVSKIAGGTRSVISGAAMLLVPEPTIVMDLKGMRLVTKGIINVCYGIVEVIIVILR